MNEEKVITYQSVTSTQVYLNSEDADIYLNGTMKSNVTFFIKDFINVGENTIDAKISVSNAQIPVSYTLINSTNNYLNVTLSGGTLTRYNFANGNYNSTTFITLFKTTMGNNWDITFNAITNTFTLSNSVSDFQLTDSPIYSILGFKNGVTYNSTAKSLNSPYPCNFSGINRINIKSSMFKAQNFDSFNKGRCRTLATVPVNAMSNGIVFYTNITGFKAELKLSSLSSITLELLDDNRNYIDFRNVDWTIALQIDILSEINQDMKTFTNVYNQFQNVE